MSKTLKEIGYSILESATNFYIVDDESIPMPMIYAMVHDVRDALIKREFKQTKRLDAAYFTKCECVPVECRPIICYDNEGNEQDSGLVEVYIDVPFINNSLGYYSFKYVGTPDLQNPFRYLNTPHDAGGPQTRGLPGYMYIGDKLILRNVSANELGVVTIIALTKYGACTNDPCDLDKEYNMPSDLIHELEGICLKRLGLSFQIKKDQVNNTSKE